MNVTIRAMCPHCGPQALAPSDVTVTVYSVNGGAYRFLCPCCLDVVERDTSERIVAILIAEGCYFLRQLHPFLDHDLEELRAWMDSTDPAKWDLLTHG